MTGLLTALGSIALLLLLVFSALLNAVTPASDQASVAASQEAAAAIEVQARRNTQANQPADSPPPAPVAVAAQIVAAELKADVSKKTLGVTTKDALAKISAWGIPLKPGPAGQWSAINEEKAVMLTLDDHNGKLVKFEYGGFMVKNSPNNTQHFMRVRQAMDWLLKNARKEDKDQIIAEIANELSTEKPITYDVEKQGEIRSTYSAAIGLWVFVVEAK